MPTMPENAQYKPASAAEIVPTRAPNLRSTFDVSVTPAESITRAMVRKDLHEQLRSEGKSEQAAGY